MVCKSDLTKEKLNRVSTIAAVSKEVLRIQVLSAFKARELRHILWGQSGIGANLSSMAVVLLVA